MMSLCCASVHVSRSSDKREIVWGWGPGSGSPKECWRLRLLENGDCSACCYLSERLPTSLRLGVASLVLDDRLLCNSSCALPFDFHVGSFRFVRVGLWSGSVCGKAFFFFLTSRAFWGAMCRIVSIVVWSCCCGVAVAGSMGAPLGASVPFICLCLDVALHF
jgi:hypothetical protein